MYVSIDGHCIPHTEAMVSVFSRAVQYGDGVFETMRIIRGRPFLLERHIQRLIQGLSWLGIMCPMSISQISTAVYELIGRNSTVNAVLKIIAYRDDGLLRTPVPAADGRLVMFIRPFDECRFERSQKGITAWIASSRRNCRSPLPRLKSLNYLENIIALREASTHGADEAIFLNIFDMLAEGATSNLFIVKDRTILTPPDDAGILQGVTRSIVIELAHHMNIPLSIENISYHDLMNADEAFCTNALMGVMPLCTVNGHSIGSNVPGQVTRTMQNKLTDMMSNNRE
ncbi:MAG: aminotransferase class IV [Desulfobacterota bacterium]|nr:aminotransferase class IV [Thermodesulfobacteriota bacterium]